MEQDDSVLDEPRTLTVTIAGKEYTWAEPPRAKRRQILADAMELEENYPLGDKSKLSLFVRRWDEMVSLLLKYNTEMAKDKKKILNAEEDEILEAYNAVVDFVQAPFERTMARLREKSQE